MFVELHLGQFIAASFCGLALLSKDEEFEDGFEHEFVAFCTTISSIGFIAISYLNESHTEKVRDSFQKREDKDIKIQKNFKICRQMNRTRQLLYAFRKSTKTGLQDNELS